MARAKREVRPLFGSPKLDGTKFGSLTDAQWEKLLDEMPAILLHFHEHRAKAGGASLHTLLRRAPAQDAMSNLEYVDVLKQRLRDSYITWGQNHGDMGLDINDIIVAWLDKALVDPIP